MRADSALRLLIKWPQSIMAKRILLIHDRKNSKSLPHSEIH